MGAALRVGKDDVNVGSSGHSLDTDAYSLSFYATAPHTDQTYIDINVGPGYGQRNESKKVSGHHR